jgi:hypothetical protein
MPLETTCACAPPTSGTSVFTSVSGSRLLPPACTGCQWPGSTCRSMTTAEPKLSPSISQAAGSASTSDHDRAHRMGGSHALNAPDMLSAAAVGVCQGRAILSVLLIRSRIGTHPVALEVVNGDSIAVVAAGDFVHSGRASLIVARLAPLGLWLPVGATSWWAAPRFGQRTADRLVRRGVSTRLPVAYCEHYIDWYAVGQSYSDSGSESLVRSRTAPLAGVPAVSAARLPPARSPCTSPAVATRPVAGQLQSAAHFARELFFGRPSRERWSAGRGICGTWDG